LRSCPEISTPETKLNKEYLAERKDGMRTGCGSLEIASPRSRSLKASFAVES